MAERAQTDKPIFAEDDTLVTRPDGAKQNASSPPVSMENTIEVDDQLLARLDEDFELGAACVDAHTTLSVVDASEDERNIMNIGSVRFKGYLTLAEQGTGIKIKIDGDDLEHATIGRLNRLTGVRPTIDLTDFIKPHDGVSRYHAVLARRGELLTVTDQGSRNGTFLNGQRIITQQSRILRDGDHLRVGRIVLKVSFDNLETEIAQKSNTDAT